MVHILWRDVENDGFIVHRVESVFLCSCFSFFKSSALTHQRHFDIRVYEKGGNFTKIKASRGYAQNTISFLLNKKVCEPFSTNSFNIKSLTLGQQILDLILSLPIVITFATLESDFNSLGKYVHFKL